MNYYVLSPWAETGGPEALHQLCSTLNEIGEKAYIYYYGNDYSQIHKGEFVQKYSEYNLNSSDVGSIDLLDKKENTIIVPEVFPIKIIERFKNCKVVFWRLSIFTHGQELNSPIFKEIYQGCQSDTQFNILKKSKLFDRKKYFMLSDYINLTYLKEEKNILKDRKNYILYNPKKGLKHTQILINELSGYNVKLIPISGLSNEQINGLICASKVYIDFGDHPGKDRIPRECASGGCVVITGTQNCGDNIKDISIQTKFEYDQINDIYDYKTIAKFILEVCRNYEFYFNQQKDYRNLIRKEKKIFIKEVQNMISILKNEI